MGKAKRTKRIAGAYEETAQSRGLPGRRTRYIVCALLIFVTLAVYTGRR